MRGVRLRPDYVHPFTPPHQDARFNMHATTNNHFCFKLLVPNDEIQLPVSDTYISVVIRTLEPPFTHRKMRDSDNLEQNEIM